jgi:uncharacterized membrane protein YhaH (DUF805 family)
MPVFRINGLAPMPTQRPLRSSTREEFMHWYLEVLKKYTLFTGRARRSEYWYFVLVNLVLALVLGMVDGVLRRMVGMGPLGMLYGLAVLVPSIAVAIRRLHDTDRSGWWVLLGLVPIVGLVLIWFLAQDSMPSTNRYGQNPKLALV